MLVTRVSCKRYGDFKLALPIDIKEEDTHDRREAAFALVVGLNNHIQKCLSLKPTKSKDESDPDMIKISRITKSLRDCPDQVVDLALPIYIDRGLNEGAIYTMVVYVLNEKLKELTSSKSVVEL